MKRRDFSKLSAGLAFTGAVGVPKLIKADDTYTLRIASLAPKGSVWHKAFRAWAGTVKKDSGGKLDLKFYLGGTQGDERDYIRKMKSGQIDGAAVTTTGLGQIVRPVLVLQLPGLFDSYKSIDKVRDALAGDFNKEFESAGYRLMGWGDVGQARFFSNQPIERPSDLKKVTPWQRGEDHIFGEMLKTVGAKPRKLGVNEVLTGLQTGQINAFPSSCLAAVSLQWYNHCKYVTKQSNAILIGATIIKKDKIDALPADLQKILADSSERAHKILISKIRSSDDKAYKALLSRGVKEVDVSKYKSEWDGAAKKVRNNLAGKLYPKALLDQVEKLV